MNIRRLNNMRLVVIITRIDGKLTFKIGEIKTDAKAN
jgi:hypothetical protein